MAERYTLKGVFGTRAASNATSACNECGAVVYDTKAHDRWHDPAGRSAVVVKCIHCNQEGTHRVCDACFQHLGAVRRVDGKYERWNGERWDRL